ncbi:MAG: mechanosensitive ion channel, partial [Gemmatimonadetes bacterium]|nr:mechanosensitive ion channel [Gemmatimonadota bacterium]NIQ58142.1 mechanosensitive ion channel [Gemmatimonadota bacterium]NIU78346.1 mechanosensitive ion channel [Gammaproteobacteria bacterium]NIX40390.1 mechanosensitive ion channel [Gemmatimonadota bacterium]NIX47289.1 mechanosensitive ion channel [Gemmatimonadota bacterium]
VVGDRIQIGAHAGDVIDQRIFQFIVLEIGNWVDADQSTGRIIHIPNGLVFREPLANYTRGMQYIWNEIRVLVTFESNWKRAKQILDEIVQER